MPRPTKTIGLVRHTDTDAYGTVRADDLEDIIEDAEIDGVALEGAGFNHIDKEHGEDDPPKIVRELTAELLPDEIASALAGSLLGCHSSLQTADKSRLLEVAFFFAVLRVLGGDGGVIGVDAQGALFVDVGVAHRYDNGVDAYVHHYDVKD